MEDRWSHTWIKEGIATLGAGHHILVGHFFRIEKFAVRGNFSYLALVVLNR